MTTRKKATKTTSAAKKKASKKVTKKVAAPATKATKKTATKKVSAKKATSKKTAKTKVGAKKNAPAKPTAKKAAKKKATTKKASSKKVTAAKKNASKTKTTSAKKGQKAVKTKSKTAAPEKKAAKSKMAATKATPKKSLAKAAIATSKSKGLSTIRKKLEAANAQAEKDKLAEKMHIQNMTSPSLATLKPFREAAKRNKKQKRAKERSRKQKTAFLAKPPRKGKKYTIDLRIHTPGTLGFFSTTGVDSAQALVRLAKVKRLQMIGLTDWYNASYIDQVKELAEKSNITILPGVDIRCQISECDSVTLTALFPETFTSADIFSLLALLKVPQSAHGRADYCVTLPFKEVITAIEDRGGVMIPSRVDKTPFRHLAIPAMVEEYGIHAFDLVHAENPEYFRENWPEGEFTFFTFSNANALGQIGSRTSEIKLTSPGFEGLRELVGRRHSK